MTIQVSPSAIANSQDKILTQSLLDRDSFLTKLLEEIEAKKSPYFTELRQKAVNTVRHSTIPTTREEEWRFTDLSALRQVNLHLETGYDAGSGQVDILPEAANSRLVFVNGDYAPELSAIAGLPDGVVVGNWTGLNDTQQGKLLGYLGQSEGALEVFTALNTAAVQDVAVILIPKDTIVETPIHLVFVAASDGGLVQPRCLVVAGSGSQVTLIEEFQNRKPEAVYFTNAVTEIFVEENAQVSHSRVEWDGENAFHVGKTAVTQARYSRYTCNAVNLGGKLSRHNLEILQAGEQTETTLNGLTVTAGEQVADTHSAIALNFPHGKTQQLQKNIIADQGHVIFNGKVFVPKLAQLTDAAQLNRNLLLSPKARVDTKPQLEITADNVKCAHGATVSQLEDDEIFYLQSRGIDADSARHLLVYAFAAEIINHIPVDSLREKLTNTVNRF
ncbi:Fe-S cluster assembly protein SufD [Calothrix sp. 336/3]|uniref:Fe-S cluster assembly protein SufD n=1 Tax=Calothrix sp. 336/3 TaxID=1337936 RepID=UPI0004E44F5B|nr:Fe-S cluster assembly protein SufD [Calothrix sp. 336/3]AKG22698.1 hypothetical protein IJ00_16725 [Calothrix sp. 336/3]